VEEDLLGDGAGVVLDQLLVLQPEEEVEDVACGGGREGRDGGV
jgi:hypothetical protein